SAAFLSWAWRRRPALNSRARRRKSSVPGRWGEGSPGKPVVKVGGLGVVKSTAYLRRGFMYIAAVYLWAAVSFRLPPFLLPPGVAFLGATLAPKSKLVSNLLLAIIPPPGRHAPLHYTAECLAAASCLAPATHSGCDGCRWDCCWCGIW